MQPSPAAQHFLHVASPMSPATHGFSPTAPAVNLIPPRSSSHQVSLAGSTPSSSLSMSMSPLAMPNGNMPTPSPLNFNINGIPNGTTSGAALSLGQQQQQQHPYITPNFMPYDNAQTPSPITKAANYPNAMQAGGGLAMNNWPVANHRQCHIRSHPIHRRAAWAAATMGTCSSPSSSSTIPLTSNHNCNSTAPRHVHFWCALQLPQFAHMPQAADFPARSLPLKRDAYDDMDELDLFLDNVKKAKITPSYNDGLAQSLDYLAPGLLSGNLLQTPILATMPASDSTTVLGFLDQLESAVCQQDADIAAFLDQLDAGVFAADPMLAGASEMQPIHHAPPLQQQQQQPMFTSFAQHSQLPPPTQAQQPVQQPATTRSSSTTSSSSSSCYPGHYSTTTGASLGAAIGLPEAHVMSPSPSSPSPTPAPVDRDRAKAAGAKKQKDKNVLFELRSTSSAEPSTKDLKKKKSKDNVLKAVVDQVAAAASASSSANGARSGPPVSKPLGQFMRVAQDLVGGGSSSSSSSSTRSAAAAARSPTNPPALPPRSPIPAASSDMDALAGAMSSMSIHTPAPASHALVNPAVQRAVYHIRAIRALRWHLHDQIAAEKRQREGAAAAGTAGTEAPVSVS
ncbi:hypothetical protein BCR44DRAFT_1313905 [Catenaria anguillulae PL171]|uniref:Uncharacterized protein n=1 Tax=Catenaria anguillulae PL171 TaxID=765915 RepID=A0A1Y2H8W0_9FUNG|nr:hypothetical protein BCR44DRAFT_1313905 [Catenaria anguillulae PL171]